jgi:branched-chain amino acid transport system substrate-binding protein
LEEAGDPVMASDKIISYAPADTSEFVSAKSPYAFRGAPRNALIEQPLADWLRANKKIRAAIIVSKDAWGSSVAAPMRAAVKDAGGTVVVDETIQTFSPDAADEVAVILTKVKATNADVILWTGYEGDATALVEKRAELGLNIPLIAASNVYSELLSRNVVSPSELKNAYLISVSISPNFIAKFKDAYGEAPGNYADRAYDGLILLVRAIQNAPAKDSDSVSAYIHNDLDYQGYAGEYKFNDNGDVIGGDWIISPIVAQ